MRTDKFGQIIFDEKDIIELYYQNPDRKLKNTLVDQVIHFHSDLQLSSKPSLKIYRESQTSVREFDLLNQSVWLMPDSYKKMDIAKHVLDKCQNDAELQRVGEELLLYQERNLFDLLRYLKYLVDTMRKNNIVWGVGRGSSVASFVLFLLEVHRINSLYYDLSITEFIK
jgi:DNA polymerase III alpha subunit